MCTFLFVLFLFTAQRVKDVEAIRSQHPDKIPVSVFCVCVCVCVCVCECDITVVKFIKDFRILRILVILE